MDTIFTKYRDIDIDIKHVSKMHEFLQTLILTVKFV